MEQERRNDGGPAFANLKTNGCGPTDPRNEGMSLRDWFAGQALTGLAAGQSEGRTANILDGFIGGKPLSEAAYLVADAMLKARK